MNKAVINEVASILNCLAMEYDIGNYYEFGLDLVDKVNISNRTVLNVEDSVVGMYDYIMSGGETPEKITIEQYLDYKAHAKCKDKTYRDWVYTYIGMMTTVKDKPYNISNDKQLQRVYGENRSNLLLKIANMGGVAFRNEPYTIRSNSLIFKDLSKIKSGCTLNKEILKLSESITNESITCILISSKIDTICKLDSLSYEELLSFNGYKLYNIKRK